MTAYAFTDGGATQAPPFPQPLLEQADMRKAVKQMAEAEMLVFRAAPETAPAFDPVTKPAHYADSSIETIDYLRDKLGENGFIDYCKGNAIKYLSRAGKKDAEAQDLAKAAWYCQMAAHTLDPQMHRDPRT